jgi:hypothetical protein
MRLARSGCLLVFVAAFGSAPLGCKSGGGSNDAGVAGTTGAGGGGGGQGGGGQGDAAAGCAGGAGGQVRDCLPSCVVNLRRSCERPAVDAGTCIRGAGVNCYSNGVREITSGVDGGQLYVYTLPDGQTPCYQVFVDSASVQHFQTTSGQDVAQGISVDGGYAVACDGMTVPVNFNDPSCATLNVASCQFDAGCP